MDRTAERAAAILHGDLLLADISGYTSYLAGVELDHAHEILTGLLEVLVAQLQPVFEISKLEGDAVFVYRAGAPLSGEALLDLIDACYAAFRGRLEAARRRTTCECRACRAMPGLDLKFLVHHGSFMVQRVAGIHELVGTDVNLVHRLLKNHVAEATGWHAYALLTEAVADRLAPRPEGLHAQAERYEHLGAVQTSSYDLRPRYQARAEARRVALTAGTAHVVRAMDLPAPPAVVWDWLNDPRKRSQWMHAEVSPQGRPGGRNGAGARNHCAHGRNELVVEDVLDWRPFEYFTVLQAPRGIPATLMLTQQLTPTAAGTRLEVFARMEMRGLPEWARRWLCRRLLRASEQMGWHRIPDLIAREAAPVPVS